MKRLWLALALGLLTIALLGWNLHRNHTQASDGAVRKDEIPISRLAANVPDAAKAGDPDAAIRQLHQLLGALRAHNWDSLRVPVSLQTLSDAKFAESPIDRNYEHICFPNQPKMPEKYHIPEFEQVAFFTNIYARYNRAYYKGDRSQSHPSGFVIVGWKDGRIEKVPIMQLRRFTSSNPDVPGEMVCYPGMAVYDTAKPDSMLSDAASK